MDRKLLENLPEIVYCYECHSYLSHSEIYIGYTCECYRIKYLRYTDHHYSIEIRSSFSTPLDEYYLYQCLYGHIQSVFFNHLGIPQTIPPGLFEKILLSFTKEDFEKNKRLLNLL